MKRYRFLLVVGVFALVAGCSYFPDFANPYSYDGKTMIAHKPCLHQCDIDQGECIEKYEIPAGGGGSMYSGIARSCVERHRKCILDCKGKE
ncbi:MAG: hypothetical protein U9N14_02515 [Pseudomonadota bacterium]|nr:hypothetical protein [Pseudomonadota bacterium]